VWGAAQDVTQVRHARRASLHTQAAWHAERRTVDSFHRAALPLTLPIVAGADLGAIYLAAPERLDIGAGWYDVRDIGGGRVLMSVGKVAGHDQPAAAAMAPIPAVLRAYALDDPDPAHLLTRLNRLLAGTLQDDTFVTVVVAVYEPGTGLLRIANAGHPAPLVVSPRCDGDPVAISLTHRGPALGVFPGAEFTEQCLTLAPGSVLCAYTDGLTDRHNEPASADARRLPYAVARALGQFLDERPHCLPDAQDLAERIIHEVLGGDPPDDDVCLAVLWATGQVI
jgi:serine phosphatase RsbU (regulator of sigma subunit)